jgi:hypothetical protein
LSGHHNLPELLSHVLTNPEDSMQTTCVCVVLFVFGKSISKPLVFIKAPLL